MTESEWLDIFGDNLAEMLIEKNMTQRDLAEETGLAESSISSYIHKKKLPGIKAILNIAHALECDSFDLIDFGDTIQ